MTPTPRPLDDLDMAMRDAETDWLAALTADTQDGMRLLMEPDCLVVHGAGGHISGVEDFLRFAARVGSISEVTVHDVAVQQLPGVTIVSCLQESRIAVVPDATPYVIQAAVTRVWVARDAVWRLVHMQMARRQPPA